MSYSKEVPVSREGKLDDFNALIQRGLAYKAFIVIDGSNHVKKISIPKTWNMSFFFKINSLVAKPFVSSTVYLPFISM